MLLLLIVASAITSPFYSFAQGGANQSNPSDYTSLAEILPPAPNAAALTKYSPIEVGLATGTPNITVPLYSYESNNLKLPISINYTSSGFKVGEVASQVGTSWTLDAGGVITRTVMGGIDEQAQRVSAPADFPNKTQNFMDFAQTLSNTTTYDGEPDLFTFNFDGQSGQFLLDSNRNPVLLTYSALKIEKDFSGTAQWNFKITAPNGVQYFFGGSQATETTNKYQYGSCGRSYPAFAATAWYITQVVHPNRDTLKFTYTSTGYYYPTGVNEVMYSQPVVRIEQPGTSTSPPVTNTSSSCQIGIQVHGVLLDQINSTSGGTIKFIYQNRTDIGDKLVNRIEIYQRGQTSNPFKFFNFYYQTTISSGFTNSFTATDTTGKYRPFLIKLEEGSSTSSTLKTHNFSYNNLSGLPPRLSFAQDAYGYFNGQNNSTLVPPPAWGAWQTYLPNANANRKSDFNYASMGMLTKIQYPTKGFDSLVYESNTGYQAIPGQAPRATVALEGSGSGPLTPVTYTSPVFQLFQTEQVNIGGSCLFDPNGGYPEDDIHNTCLVEIIDTTSHLAVYSRSIPLNQVFADSLRLSGGNYYQLKIIPRGADAQGAATLSYQSGPVPPPTYANLPIAGVRLQKILTSTGAPNDVVQTKHYYYYDLANPTQSTANYVFQANFEKYLKLYVNVPSYCMPNEYDYYSMYSNSQTNLYVYPAPVYYSSVIESFGDSFQNGGIEHHFQLYPDIPGGSWSGDPITNAPYTSYSYKNGKEIYACTFKMNGSTIVPIKKIFTHYTEDPRINSKYTSYLVHKNYTPTCQLNPPDAAEIGAYDLASYDHFRKWLYIDTIRTWNYDGGGQNYAEDLNISTYGNVSHTMLTQQTSTKSDGRINILKYTYPSDTTFSGAEETARQALITNSIIGTPLVTKKMADTTISVIDKVSYNVFPNGLILPHVYNVKIGTNQAEDRILFSGYNNYGKITSQSFMNGPVNSYQWGYNSMYPVAKVINAPPNDIFYDSFEEGNGNSTNSKTGHYCYDGSVAQYSKDLSGLDAGTYTLSYWSKSGGAWTWNLNSNIHVTGSTYPIRLPGQIDDVRFYPSKAQMSTYTYDPLIGLASSTDPKGEVIYYEYDGLQRLQNVKDKDGNIIKHYCYNYQNEEVGCPVIRPVLTPKKRASRYTNTFVTANVMDNEWKQDAPPGYTIAGDNGATINAAGNAGVNAGRFAYFSTGGTITPLTYINGTLSFTAKGSGTIEIQLIASYNTSVVARKTFTLSSSFQNFSWALSYLYPQTEMMVGIIVNGGNSSPQASVQFQNNFNLNLAQAGMDGTYTRFRADSTSLIGNSETAWYGWNDQYNTPRKKYLQHSAYARMRFQTSAQKIAIEYVRDFYDKRVVNLFAMGQTQNSADFDANGNVTSGYRAVNTYTQVTGGHTYTISGLTTTNPVYVWYNQTTPLGAPQSLVNQAGAGQPPVYQITAPSGATNLGLLVQNTNDFYTCYTQAMIQDGAIGTATQYDGTIPSPYTAFTGYVPSHISGPAIFINGQLYKYYQVEGNDIAKIIQFVADTLPAGNKTVEVMMPGQGTYLPADPHVRRSGTYLRAVYFHDTTTTAYSAGTTAQGSVVYIHDSILSGYNISSDAQNNVWMMKTKTDPSFGFTGDIFSEGYAGRILYTDISTPALTTQFAKKLASFGVDKYWFQIGVNDYSFLTPIDKFYTQYKSLIEQLKALRPKVKIYIQDIGPGSYEGPNAETVV